MREETTGKIVYKASYYSWRKNELTLENLHDYGMKGFDSRIFSQLDLNKAIPTVDQIPENSKLIFHSTSKFPRHKLEITTFKRKIKENLADYLVGNSKKIDLRSRIGSKRAFVFDTHIIMTWDEKVTLEELKKLGPLKNKEFIEVVEDYHVILLNKEQILTLEYLQGMHTIPLISDEQLNKAVDGKTDKMTEDDLNSIIELIQSKDRDNINLATKLFTQFNLASMPLFTRLFLMMFHETIKRFSANSSVVYKNLITLYPPSYLTDSQILALFKAIPSMESEEKVLVTNLMLRYISPGAERFIEDRNKLLNLVGLKYDYKIVDA